MFDPEEFFYLAKRLHNEDSSDSCRIRTCINRAYYAAFLVVRENSSIAYEKKKHHDEVIKDLQKKDPSLGQLLKDLFQRRIKADYILDNKISARESEIALTKSEIVLKGMGRTIKKQS